MLKILESINKQTLHLFIYYLTKHGNKTHKI